MQEDLRLLILIVGLVGVVFIIIDGIRKRSQKRKIDKFDQRVFENTTNQNVPNSTSDPLFGELQEKEIVNTKPAASQKPAVQKFKTILNKKSEDKSTKKNRQSTQNQKELIVLAIRSRTNGGFNGRSLEAIFKSHHFVFGEKNNFHRHLDFDENKQVIYSLANWTEDGAFDLEALKHQRVKGLMLYMTANAGDIEAKSNFDKMLTTARQLAATLNGELCDMARNPISAKTIMQFKQKITNLSQPQLDQMPE